MLATSSAKLSRTVLVWLIPAALVVAAVILLNVGRPRVRESPRALPGASPSWQGGALAELLDEARRVSKALALLDGKSAVKLEAAAEAFARVQRWLASHDALDPDDRAWLEERGLALGRLRRLSEWGDAVAHGQKLSALTQECVRVFGHFERLLSQPRAPYR